MKPSSIPETKTTNEINSYERKQRQHLEIERLWSMISPLDAIVSDPGTSTETRSMTALVVARLSLRVVDICDGT